jgi:hypothetical protein
MGRRRRRVVTLDVAYLRACGGTRTKMRLLGNRKTFQNGKAALFLFVMQRRTLDRTHFCSENKVALPVHFDFIDFIDHKRGP